MIKPWLKRQGYLLKERWPQVAGRIIEHYEQISTSAFALGVALIFLILSIITFISVYLGKYQLWLGLLIGFLLHLFIHFGQWIVFKRYVPVIITSILHNLTACIH